MSYCRLPSMIYPTKTGIRFMLDEISNEDIDIFLYKIFLTRREELAKRIKHGKDIIMEWEDSLINDKNNAYDKSYKDWLLSKEDEFFKVIINFKEENK